MVIKQLPLAAKNAENYLTETKLATKNEFQILCIDYEGVDKEMLFTEST